MPASCQITKTVASGFRSTRVSGPAFPSCQPVAGSPRRWPPGFTARGSLDRHFHHASQLPNHQEGGLRGLRTGVSQPVVPSSGMQGPVPARAHWALGYISARKPCSRQELWGRAELCLKNGIEDPLRRQRDEVIAGIYRKEVRWELSINALARAFSRLHRFYALWLKRKRA